MTTHRPDTAPSQPERRYHHGDLAAALIDAGEAELTEKGIEAFSLRGVAKRAGVSHAAPAHHFGDVDGLLTALAAQGFERFVARQNDFRRLASPDARAQLEASGVGYVAFAVENPALFRLMFGSDRPNFEDARLRAAAGLAYQDLATGVAAVTGQHLQEGCGSDAPNLPQATDIAAVWAMAHGLADLLAAGRLKTLQALPEATRHQAVASILSRALPAA